MKFIRRIRKALTGRAYPKRNRTGVPNSPYGKVKANKEARENLKAYYEQEAKNKYLKSKIEAKKLEIKEAELDLDEEALEVKSAKLERDKAKYNAQADDYNYRDGDDSQNAQLDIETQGDPFEAAAAQFIGGMANAATNTGSKGQAPSTPDRREPPPQEAGLTLKEFEKEVNDK